MGSYFTTVYGKGTDPNEVYRRLYQEAELEHGTDPYSGTIATSSGCFAWDQSGPRHRSAAEQVAQRAVDDDDRRLSKWDSWAYVPVARDEDFDHTTKTLTVDVTSAADQQGEWQALLTAASAAAPAGYTLAGVNVTDVEQTFGRKRTVGAGARTTTYHVEAGHRGTQTYPTLAAAEAAARDLLERIHANAERSPRHAQPVDIDIEGVIRKSDAPLVRHSLVRKKKKVKVEATYVKPRGPLHAEGFLFFGWAAT